MGSISHKTRSFSFVIKSQFFSAPRTGISFTCIIQIMMTVRAPQEHESEWQKRDEKHKPYPLKYLRFIHLAQPKYH